MDITTSPLATQAPIGDDPIKGRRKVRLFAQDSSSSDEGAPVEPPTKVNDDSVSGHLRTSSFPGSGNNQPKLSRSGTFRTSSNAAPPPSGPATYTQWRSKYRTDPGGSRPPHRATSVRRSRGLVRELDPDADYARGDDWDSDDDEEDDIEGHGRPVKALVAEAVRRATKGEGDAVEFSSGYGQPKSLLLATPPPDSAGPEEGNERLEWQSMLASVLGGDILRGESSRIGVELPSNESFRKTIAQNLWWQIRARLRNRTEEEEKRRVEQRRNRIVDPVLEEIENFVVKPESENGISALDQVAYILQKLDVIESLYPNQQAFRHDKPLYDSEKLQSRVDALSAWYSVVTQLQSQLQILQKWTGTEDLDITRPNTTKEKALVGKNRFHPLDAKARAYAQNDAADDSTFVDRILKEDSLRRTFEKRIFMDQLATIQSAKQTLITHSPMFAELNLPPFQYELLRIISFPGRLIIEALKTRLRAAERLTNPDLMVIDDMADSFRNSVSLAIVIRRQYEEIVAPDPDNRWNIPDSFPEAYREVILKCIKMHFKLLHWKLKGGFKAIYFRDTEVLEDEWEFLYDAAESVEGVDQVVAETLCNLTNKLMGRVTNYFDSSLHVPVPIDAPDSAKPHRLTLQDGRPLERQPMTTEQMVTWYSKILDSIKMRYRKLQRFARRLTQRFENSAEYLLEEDDTEFLVEQLHQSGHFLIYTGVFEEQGTYIFADGSLWERESDVRQLLCRVFAVSLSTGLSRHERDLPEEPQDDEDDTEGCYLLIISPRSSFAWTGAVMTIDDLGPGKTIDFALEDNRIRLIADGPMSRLTYCKMLFLRSFVDPETQIATLKPTCVVEQQAHLPRVNKELKRIARSAHRLSECIIESAAHVSRTLRGAPGTQDLIENWYLFASDHGHRVAIHMDHTSWARFSRLLMRLAISWVSFICDHCDPTDRKTFRWTVNALEYAMLMTRGNNILHLTKQEFSLLRAKVANCMTLLISHFDILGARSSIEAKKEAERLEALRHLAQLYERDDEDDWLLPRTPSPTSQPKMIAAADRSLRICREDRLELIQALEEQLAGLSTDQHLIGRVLDEEVSEDRALVFLAASSSNISLRWQQGGFIGGGANGSVYLGINLDSGGIMAVKEIRVQDITNSPALYKQIKDEADVMQMLSHPNIVDYYGIEVHRDRVYIFEEYCPGGSLANLLEHGRVEDEDVIMVYTWQMLQGLEYLHSKGVEHRDVKPDNILLGANSVLKYVDFGAAKVITKVNRTMAKTRAIRGGNNADAGPAVMNSLAGTPMYLAPEVIKGGKSRLGASDIWSLGCVVLEVTTGRKPWSNLDNEWAIMFHIGIATQHPPLPEPGQLSDLGIDFIEQCLTLDPLKRPNATELLHHPWLAAMMELAVADVSPTASSMPSTLVGTNVDGVQEDGAYNISTPCSTNTPLVPQASYFTGEQPSPTIVTPGLSNTSIPQDLSPTTNDVDPATFKPVSTESG